jgi:CubicO group peptidase (beta-lactamase class C family)
VVDLPEWIGGLLNRRSCVGLAVGVIRDGGLQVFAGHGLADVATARPITPDTVFRIASVTKTFTAIAVMQLWEEGLIDLEAPANAYLRSFRLVAGNPRWAPATVRHLLTHTAGIPEVRSIADLVHPGWGPLGARPAHLSVPAGGSMPTLSDYYRAGLRIVVEPGTEFAYTNHGFAALGQIIEDVSGQPLDRYFREHLFGPLGMTHTELGRTDRLRTRLATGYVLGRRGATPVPDRDWIGGGSTGIYSTARDLALYVAGLLGGGANADGSVLRPATLATMFAPQYQPDRRLPGMGLGFFRSDPGGHRVVGHDGVLPGFNSVVAAAPDDGMGVIALTNGSPGAFTWLPLEMDGLLRDLIGIPEDDVGTAIPRHPEIWSELCGRYRLPPRISDLRGRIVMPGGVEVYVSGGRLMARMASPIPAISTGFPLEPADESDPSAFRADLSAFGMQPVRVVFEHEPGVPATAVHTDLQSVSLYRHPEGGRVVFPIAAGLGALAAGGALAARGALAVRRRRGRVAGPSRLASACSPDRPHMTNDGPKQTRRPR